MTVNLNNYNYFCTDSIGSVLKKPLFKVVSHMFLAVNVVHNPYQSLAWRIANFSFHYLMAVTLLMPASMAWLVGKSISYFNKDKIDREGLFLAPQPIQIPQELESDQLIDIRVLSDKFKHINYIDKRSVNQTSKKDCLTRLCNWITCENNNIYPDDPIKRQLFCKQVSVFLKGIIKKIDSNEVSKDKEKEILIELAESATHCYPTWLEVSERLFEEVNNQSETVEVKLLRFIQKYKENIILEFCQQEAGFEWHALSYVRNILGHELGLNVGLKGYDPYAAQEESSLVKSIVKWLCLEMYENVNLLTSSIQVMINSLDYDPVYRDFLVDIIREQGIKNEEDYVTEHFYGADYKLNKAGVSLMLKCIGILK